MSCVGMFSGHPLRFLRFNPCCLQTMRRMSAMFLGAFMSGSIVHGAEPVVTVQYRDKPPYSYTQDGRPVGFLMERVIEIFRRAKVQAKYEEVPVRRITKDIQENLTPICSPSWYKLPERERYANFSLPIHQDKPHMVLVGTHVSESTRAYKSFRELFGRPDLTLGIVAGVSYGAELDAAISSFKGPVVELTITPLGLAKMIRLKRMDLMLIDEEDYKYANQRGEMDAEGVLPLRFSDMPPGLKRYIMCSKKVDADVMQRLDGAITLSLPKLK